MAMRWQLAVLVAVAAMMGCGSSDTTPAASGGFQTAAGGAVAGSGGAVATGGTNAAGDPNCATTPGVGADATGCDLGLQCVDVSMGLVPGGLNYCSCSNTGRPPACDADPNVCTSYPGTTCTDVPTVGKYCAKTCTPPATAGTGGVAATTGGVAATTGGMVAGTGGATAGPDPACVSDTSASDGSECMTGLTCKDLTNTGNPICTCPNTSQPPTCTMPGTNTECTAYPGTTCTSFPALNNANYCSMACTVPGSAPLTCPDGLTCGDPVGAGASCLASGAVSPPACATQADCDSQYPGTMCITIPIINTLGCYKNCTL